MVDSQVDFGPGRWHILYVSLRVHPADGLELEHFHTKHTIFPRRLFEIFLIHCAAVPTVAHELLCVKLRISAFVSLFVLLILHVEGLGQLSRHDLEHNAHDI